MMITSGEYTLESFQLSDAPCCIFTEPLPKSFENIAGVYFVCDSSGCIYIGQSTNLYHRTKRYWRKGCTYIGVITLNKAFLNCLENNLIKEYQPRHNRSANPAAYADKRSVVYYA